MFGLQTLINVLPQSTPPVIMGPRRHGNDGSCYTPAGMEYFSVAFASLDWLFSPAELPMKFTPFDPSVHDPELKGYTHLLSF